MVGVAPAPGGGLEADVYPEINGRHPLPKLELALRVHVAAARVVPRPHCQGCRHLQATSRDHHHRANAQGGDDNRPTPMDYEYRQHLQSHHIATQQCQTLQPNISYLGAWWFREKQRVSSEFDMSMYSEIIVCTFEQRCENIRRPCLKP